MVCDADHMKHAVELARSGEGYVEPNPMVGCVIVRDGHRVGEGWHRRYGGPHAEIEALREAGDAARNATMYVTLEPCCHQGKTPPCCDAVIQAGIDRVVVAQLDPFPQVAGKGIARLRQAGITVDAAGDTEQAEQLTLPYRTLICKGRPWVMVKWAMTLDGKTAAHTGHSRWISSEFSRRVVHQLRGRVDAIMIGSRTATADDPMLTARPPGPRTATRVVLDSQALLSPKSQLVRSCGDAPVLVATGPDADPVRCERLREAGCEVLVASETERNLRLKYLLSEMGRRRWTNLLVESGGELAGSLFDLNLVDEVHVFIAPKLVGGAAAKSPIEGNGLPKIPENRSIDRQRMEVLGGDIYITGQLVHRETQRC